MKMNKKIMMPVMILLGISFVFAIGYYALFSASFTVLSSIETTCGNEDLGEVMDGGSVRGTECTITNVADAERTVTISYEADDGITTDYVATLGLSKKDTSWAATGTPISVEYTVVGDEFVVTGVEEGYTLIYYKDDESNADDAERLLTIGDIGTTDTNLPHTNDWNVGEYANYCDLANGYDDYNQCKGAKLWVVPTEDVGEDLNWANMANYYYELDLIQYNAEGEITLSPGAILTITPIYNIPAHTTGNQTVTTTVA